MIRRDSLVFGGATCLALRGQTVSSQTWSERYGRSQPIEITKVDLNGLTPGQQMLIKFRDGPVTVRYRTQKEVDAARSTPLSELPDKFARNANLRADAPATDENRSFGEDGRWLVYRPICTHLNFITFPATQPFGGEPYWINCPSHGGRYDSAGRVRAGPAPENLPIPPVRFLSNGVLEIRSRDSFSNEKAVRDSHPSDW